MALIMDIAANIANWIILLGDTSWDGRNEFNFYWLCFIWCTLLTHQGQNEFEDETIDRLRRRQRWETDDYTCRRNILNKWMTHYLTYTTMWILSGVIGKIGHEVHEEDTTSKKFLVSNFNIF